MVRRALILAAGRGERLDRPGTPKPLVDVGGQPIIARLIRQLEQRGILEIGVVVGFEGRKIKRAISRYPDIKARLTVIENTNWENGLLGSLLAGSSFVSEPFILSMADHVFDDEMIDQLVAAKIPSPGIKVLTDSRVDQVQGLDSAVKIKTEDGKVSHIGRDLKNFDGIDTGLFLATPEIFDYATKAHEQGQKGLSDALRLAVAASQLECVMVEQGQWNDVDTPADLVHAEMRLRRKLREQRVSKDAVQFAQESPAGFEFYTGEQVLTDMIVGRGFIADPTSVPLIPEKSASSPIFVFTDDVVEELYGRDFKAKLKGYGYDVTGIVLPEGEESKSLANYLYLVERVLTRGVDERSVFISLGGGVVCNVCGFIASTINRGLDLVHLPTTMMAQCDAAISHKQAINGARGKNQIGSYYAPRLVAVDVEALSTLSNELIADGLAEVIKHGLGQDPKYAKMLFEYEGSIRDLDFLEQCVSRNVELKCELAAKDPKEHREGMILQYGHTVGHPVEQLSGYALSHGQSVTIGMMVAVHAARIMGAASQELIKTHEDLIARYELPTRIPSSISVSSILDALRFNKKYLVEGTRMALLKGVGELWCVEDDFAIPVSESVLEQAIENCMEKEQ